MALLTAAACAPAPWESTSSTGGEDVSSLLAPRAGSYQLPPIQDAVDGMVVDADGNDARLFDYMANRYVLLSFIYTSCKLTEGCPKATAVLHRVRRDLQDEPELASRVRLISLSFDPERDTPEMMRYYVPPDVRQVSANDRRWVFLTTRSRSALQPILDGYGQYIVPEIDERGEPTGDIAHLLKIYLIDRSLRVRNIYSSGFLHPAVVLSDLKTLMLEDAASH